MHFNTRFSTCALFLAAAAPLAAQGRPVVIARIGDTLPAGDTITTMINPRVANSGDYMLHFKTDHPNPDRRDVLMRNGNIVARSDSGAPGGGTWESFRGLDMTDDGTSLIHAQLENVPGHGAVTEGLFLSGQPFLYEDDATGASGFGVGSYYAEFKAANINDNLQVLLRCDVHDTNLNSNVGVLMRIDLDASGNILNEDVLIKEPEIPFGQTFGITDFPGTTLGQAALNNNGGGCWSARLESGAAPNDDVCYYNTNTLIAQSAMPSGVVPGRDWADIGSPWVDSNATPSWIASLRLDSSDLTNDRLILQDGNIYVREGSPVPAFPGNTILNLGLAGPWLTDGDEVCFYAEWDGPAATSQAIFIGDHVMARKGLTTTSTGEVIDLFPQLTETFAISDDGNRILYYVVLDSGDTAYLLGQRNIGVPYCSAENNSTGTFSTTEAKGSSSVAFNTFRLVTTDMPTGEFGYYLTSLTQADVLHPGGSDGRLCLGGTIGRFNTQVQNTGADGSFAIWVDLANIPVVPAVAVVPGDTWHYQAWHRDGASSNFSLPITVTFD